MAASLPVVCIVGRPNVGKSTLFNRIIRRRKAVVDDHPGVTRDRMMARAEWEGRSFMLVDTGGLVLESLGAIETAIREQVQVALEHADVVLLVVDGREGPLRDDEEVARLLRRRGISPILVVSKVDAPSLEPAALEFTRLGLDPTFLVSGLEGRGVGEMLDAASAQFPERPSSPSTPSVRLAVIGRPNVGKSSLVNALLCEERMIVSDVPGTTRDAIDTEFRFHGRDFTLIDTAGLRRKSRVATAYEHVAALHAAESLSRADVALVVLDASMEISRQDFRIAAMPFTEGVPLVFVFNKWDIVASKETLTARDVVREAARHVPDFDHAASVFVSAKTGQRVSRIVPAALEAYEAARVEIPDERMNAFIDRLTETRSHPYVRGKMMKFWGMRQLGVAPPAFVVYCNRPAEVAENYRRHIANSVREAFGFRGTPIRLLFRRK